MLDGMTNIKASEVLKELKRYTEDLPHYSPDEVAEALEMATKALEQQPKTGQWIKYGIPRCGEQHYKCTSCGYYINFGEWGELYSREFKYCPNCGCRMVKPQEGEESE